VLLASCIRWEDAITFNTGTTPGTHSGGITFSDVDGDGAADPVVMTTGGRLVWMSNCGESCFEAQPSISIGTASTDATLAAADFNDDHIGDVVVSGSGGVGVWFGGRAAAPRPAGLVARDSVAVASGAHEAVATGDINGDGEADIVMLRVVAVDQKTVEYALGDGQGAFGPVVALYTTTSSQTIVIGGIALGDADGDGTLDVIWSGAGVDPTNGFLVGFVSVRSIATGAAFGVTDSAFFARPVAGDFDGDGLADVAVIELSGADAFSGHTIHLFRSTGTALTGFGAGGALTTVPTAATINRLLAADVDNDGHPDLVGVDTARGLVAWWQGQGAGTFSPSVATSESTHPAGPNPGAIALGEVHPGLLDLIASNPTEPAGAITYLRNSSL
jgi:FG-GAP-like repeat